MQYFKILFDQMLIAFMIDHSTIIHTYNNHLAVILTLTMLGSQRLKLDWS